MLEFTADVPSLEEIHDRIGTVDFLLFINRTDPIVEEDARGYILNVIKRHYGGPRRIRDNRSN